MSWVEKWAGKNKAKPSNFRQNINPPDNRFELNYVLEAVDLRVAIQDSPTDRSSIYTSSGNTRRQKSISFSLAKVVGKQGSRICLRHLGTDDRNDIWLMIDSDMIRHYPSGFELSVPFGYMNSHSVWNKMIAKVDKEEKLAPMEWFPQHPKDPGGNHFKVGEKVEAVDRRNAQLICPATIAEIKGNFVLISFDGWSGTFDYWATYNSQDLFPVGWCSKAKHKLQQPGPYYEITGKTVSDYNMEYSVPSQSPKTIKGRQIDSAATKRKSTKTAKKSVKESQKKCTVVAIDYDSDCTHVCDNDDDVRNKKQKLTNYDHEKVNTKSDTGFKSKSKAFSNLFRMWTEKTALETKKESTTEEKTKIEKEDLTESCVKDDNYDDDKVMSLETVVSDSVIQDDVPKSSDELPAFGFSQMSSPKPRSPSLVNSSVANSIIEDYKCLSDTSGTSYCAKLDEISMMINQSDVTKRISSLSNLPSDPYQWTIDDVQLYLINKNPTLESVAQEFRNHEIDGQALLLLSMNTLRQYMKIKLGPAIKMEHIIKDLLDGKL